METSQKTLKLAFEMMSKELTKLAVCPYDHIDMPSYCDLDMENNNDCMYAGEEYKCWQRYYLERARIAQQGKTEE